MRHARVMDGDCRVAIPNCNVRWATFHADSLSARMGNEQNKRTVAVRFDIGPLRPVAGIAGTKILRADVDHLKPNTCSVVCFDGELAAPFILVRGFWNRMAQVSPWLADRLAAEALP